MTDEVHTETDWRILVQARRLVVHSRANKAKYAFVVEMKIMSTQDQYQLHHREMEHLIETSNKMGREILVYKTSKTYTHPEGIQLTQEPKAVRQKINLAAKQLRKQLQQKSKETMQ